MTTETDPRVEAARLAWSEPLPNGLSGLGGRIRHMVSAVDAVTPRPKSGEIVVTDAMVDAALDAFYGESRRQPRRETMEGMRRAIQAALVVGPIVDPRNRAVEGVTLGNGGIQEAVKQAARQIAAGLCSFSHKPPCKPGCDCVLAAQQAILVADRARGRAYIQWRRPEEYEQGNGEDILARYEIRDGSKLHQFIIIVGRTEVLHKTVVGWAELPPWAPPTPPATDGERAPDPAPSDTTHETPGAAGVDGDAIAEIAAERRRQIEVEGWDAKRDDQEHADAELADAAACYAIGQTLTQYRMAGAGRPGHPKRTITTSLWPWELRWWKPTTPRRNLVKAGALIVAEIDRLDRLDRLDRQTAPPVSSAQSPEETPVAQTEGIAQPAPSADRSASNLRELTDRVAALERSGMAKDALLKAVTGRCMIDEHGHRLLAPLLDAAFPPELEALWPPGGCLTPTSCKLRDVCLHLHGHGHSCPHASDGGGA